MHPSLAISDTGLPLGLTTVKLWTSEQFKETNNLNSHINPT
ncbi:hypothetical protein SC858_15565 [Legionella pneumophila serogroup 9]|nr:hypothetical protein [Legionella pneumophila]STX73239.1 Uncharacterised protein [Legionella pneumophila]